VLSILLQPHYYPHQYQTIHINIPSLPIPTDHSYQYHVVSRSIGTTSAPGTDHPI
jgi:hypothetical protein